MEVIILVLHIVLALSIIGVILLQPPESGSLGGLGGGNQMAAFNGRSGGNVLTRTTAILAGLFIITSLTLAILAGHKPKQNSVLDAAETVKSEAPAVPSEPVPAKAPSVPLAK